MRMIQRVFAVGVGGFLLTTLLLLLPNHKQSNTTTKHTEIYSALPKTVQERQPVVEHQVG